MPGRLHACPPLVPASDASTTLQRDCSCCCLPAIYASCVCVFACECGCLCLCLCLSLCLHRCLCMCLCLCLLLRLCVTPCHTPLRAIPASPLHHRSCVLTLIHMYEPPHERPHVHSHRTPRIPQATGRPTLSPPLSLFLPSPPAPSVLARYFNGVPSKNLLPCTTRVASGVRCVHSAWPPLSVGHGPEHLNSPANTYYQSPPSDNYDILFDDDTLGQGSFGT